MKLPAIPYPRCLFRGCELSADFIVALGSQTWPYCQQHLGYGLDMQIHGIEFTGPDGRRKNKIYQIWAAWPVPERVVTPGCSICDFTGFVSKGEGPIKVEQPCECWKEFR